jgi:hypothetical protein
VENENDTDDDSDNDSIHFEDEERDVVAVGGGLEEKETNPEKIMTGILYICIYIFIYINIYICIYCIHIYTNTHIYRYKLYSHIWS